MTLIFNKRYTIGSLLIALLLYKCSGANEDERYQNDRYRRAADDARYQANQDAVSRGQPAPYSSVVQLPANQPISANITQSTAVRDDSGFWQNLLMGQLFSNILTRDPHSYVRRYNNDSNEKYLTNTTKVLAEDNLHKSDIKSTPAPLNISHPSVTARSYNLAPPTSSAIKQRTWTSNLKKGWGSSKPKPSSYSYKSTGYPSNRSRH